MQVRVQVAAEDGRPGALDLHRWLSEDPDVAPSVEIGLVHEDDPAALGALDVISAVFSNLTALGSLLVAIATWRDARANDAVTHIEGNGVSLRIESTDPAEIQRLLRALTTTTDPAVPAADPDTDGPSAATQ